MQIPLNDNLRIATDHYNFMLQRRRVSKSGEYWQPDKFYPKSADGLRWLVQNLVIALTDDAGPENAAEAERAAIEAARRLQKALCPVVSVSFEKLERVE